MELIEKKDEKTIKFQIELWIHDNNLEIKKIWKVYDEAELGSDSEISTE